MPIDVDTPESPGWWLKFLQAKLDAKRKRIQPLYDRFEGNAPLPRSMEAAPESAQRFFKTSRTNLADMLVKAVRYRLKVARIHTSVDAGEAGDAAAWLAWRKAGMQVEGPEIIRHMLISGDGFGMVAMDEDGPAATSEDPRQVITEHDPVRQSRMRAAANSIASGKPSSRRVICATALALAASSANCGRTRLARCTNSRTASA